LRKVFQVSQKKKVGWIDEKGSLLRQTKAKASFHVAYYDGALDADRLYPVQVGGKWGFSRPLDAEPAIAPHSMPPDRSRTESQRSGSWRASAAKDFRSTIGD